MNPQQISFAACTEAVQDLIMRYQPGPTRVDAVLQDVRDVYEVAATIDAFFMHADRIEIRFPERLCRLCGAWTRRPTKVRHQGRWHVICPACASTLAGLGDLA